MSKHMLIDAAHAEETRVVVTDGKRVEEFDFESQARKQLRGNIYLAKVTRVEPSLQAAFVEYGGNRHGFLAFSEIHPDYYQIPLADREALMREEAEEDDSPEGDAVAAGDDEEASENEDDVMEEEVARRRRRLMRRYKIQEVIKRRQIMLVQVVKEERGNKGAALTTYLSLAGRYGVLMPNTPRGGGISRKITAATDRKRLKTVVQGLDVPQGMGLIIRTAGAKRTKVEIQRDYEYLMRAWEGIREKTMTSIAPALIYEEEDLVKRAIRDMYEKEMDGIVVEGEAGFKEARDFMRMLMPAQARKITQHRDGPPLFVKHGIEDQLSQIYSPVVPLRSGGYLVINQTEALVAIDVNSGRSTRERNIEATALKTNLEAAEEACRQLRLRDLAGLIVIDFIDMDESKNNRAVEKKVKEGLSLDRARVQMGKISTFGLMEISRQRRRTGVLEGTTHVCEHCGGTGRVRTAESSALTALRAVELEAMKNGAGTAVLRVPQAVGLYILNEKRGYLERLNQTQGLFVTVLIDESIAQAEHVIERTGHTDGFKPSFEPAPDEEPDDFIADEDEDEEDDEDLEEHDNDEAAQADDGEDSEGDEPRRSHRRRRGRNRGAEAPAHAAEDDAHGDSNSDGSRRRRRRGRRGGRRAREDGRTGDPYNWARMRAPDGDPYVWLDPADVLGGEAETAPAHRSEPSAAGPRAPAPAASADAGGSADAAEMWVELPPREEKPSRRSRSRRGRGPRREDTPETAAPELAETPAETAPPEPVQAEPVQPEPVAVEEAAEAPAPKPKSRSRRKTTEKSPESAAQDEPAAEQVAAAETVTEPEPSPEPDPAEITAPPASPKRGWWRRGG